MKAKKARKIIFITGTDTDVGKTVVSAGLCRAWPAHYWKPVQAGFADPKKPGAVSHILPQTDLSFVRRFIPPRHIYPSTYTLKRPLSPNQAGKKENIYLKMDQIKVPEGQANLVIEGAGGALVPLNDTKNMSDLMKKLNVPVLVVARSGLGTLNHTFLTLGALRAKKIPVLGVVMVGPPHKDNKRDIEKQGKIKVLLELPLLNNLSPQSLEPYFTKLVAHITGS